MSESASEPFHPTSRSIVTGGIHSTLFVLALPALMEQLLTSFVGFYDTFLSGQISAAATTAVGLATYVGWLGGMMFRLVGVGAAALVARHWGAGDFAEANRTTNRALALTSVMGLLVTALLFVSAPVFADFLGMRGETRAIAIHYLRLDSLCYFFTGFTLVGGSILRASGDTRTPMLLFGFVGVLNVLAAYSLVYGIGPIPRMGVNGIVMGTVVARVTGGLLVLVGFLRGFHGLKLVAREWKLRDEVVTRILRIGIPAAADGALTWIGVFLFLTVVSRGASGVADDVALAAHVVGVRVEALTYLPADAWGFAAAAMIGQALGAGNPERARRCGHAAALQCSLLAGSMSVLYYFAAEAVYRFMHGDPQVVLAGVPAFRMLAFFQIPLVLGTVYVHALRGAGDTRYPLWINLFGIFLVRLPLSYGCGVLLGGGLVGAWIGMCADLAVRAVLAMVRYMRGAWIKTLI